MEAPLTPDGRFREFWRKLYRASQRLSGVLKTGRYTGGRRNSELMGASGHPQEDSGPFSASSPQLVVRAFQSHPARRVPKTIGNEQENVVHWNNAICTNLYRWWSFLPLNLFQQVIIPSNLYFIVMAVLQLIRPISDSGGVPTFLLPILIVMAVTMLKDLYEDIKRRNSDYIENSSIANVLDSDGKLRSVTWKELKPGDVVYVKADEQIPADLVLLTCADSFGICYLETVQLDGETNLKGRTCFSEVQELYRRVPALADAQMEIAYGRPNALLYSFNGILRLYNEAFVGQGDILDHCVQSVSFTNNQTEAKPEPLTPVMLTQRSVSEAPVTLDTNHGPVWSGRYVDLPVNINQFVWRGSRLSNTEWITGLVVYTGHNTRIFRNTQSRGLKYSTLLKTYNRHAIVLACTQFLLCLGAGIGYALSCTEFSDTWYLTCRDKHSEVSSDGIVSLLTLLGTGFGRYVLLLSYFVPITLFVQLEIVKWFQAYFLTHDKDMRGSCDNAHPPSVQTVSLMEELGNVTHVFTDKTGTLTLNLMQLRCIAVGHELFGLVDFTNRELTLAEDSADLEKERQKRDANYQSVQPSQITRVTSDVTMGEGAETEDETGVALSAFRMHPNPYVNFDAWTVLRTMDEESDFFGVRESFRMFLLILSICHSALPKKGVVYKPWKDRTARVGSEVSLQGGMQAHTEKTEEHASERTMEEGRRIPRFEKISLVEWKYKTPVTSGPAGYDASSPDEVALVSGASHLGVEFLQRPTLKSIQLGLTNEFARDVLLSDKQKAYLSSLCRAELSEGEELADVFPKKGFEDDRGWLEYFQQLDSGTGGTSRTAPIPAVTFDVLEMIEFDNVRKKMSVVIRDSTGKLIMLSKGADSAMLAGASKGNSVEYLEELKEQLSDMSVEGLRTLVFGYKEVTERAFASFVEQVAKAKSRGSEEELLAIYEAFERNLILVGCTGIDDKLQPEVPGVIQDLRDAGVKVWVLTGDKVETAISIGHSCHVLTDSTYNAIINGRSHDEVRSQMHQYMTFVVAGQLANDAFDQLLATRPWIQQRPSTEISALAQDATATVGYSRYHSPRNQFRRRRLHCWHCGTGRVVRDPGLPADLHSDVNPQKGRGELRSLPSPRQGPGGLWCGCGAFGRPRRQSRRRQAPQTMPWEDFIRVLTCQARRKPVVLEPQQLEAVPLTAEQIDELIQEYLQSFHTHSDKGAGGTCSSRGGGSGGAPAEPGTSSMLGVSCQEGANKDRYQLKSFAKAADSGLSPRSPPATSRRGKSFVEDVKLNTPACGDQGLKTGMHPPEDTAFLAVSAQDVGSDQSISPRAPEFEESVALSTSTGHNGVTQREDWVLSESASTARFDHVSDLGREKSERTTITPDGRIRRSTRTLKEFLSPHDRATPNSEGVPEELSPRVIVTTTLAKPQASSKEGRQQQQRLKASRVPAQERLMEAVGIMTTGSREVQRYDAVAITCTGEALGFILVDEELRRYFFGLANLCATVIACRVTPKQKAEIVHLASEYLPKTVALSIGDGANDVGMIIKANVGVGIAGSEGMQAARAADFSISEFRLLRNLLFHYGHENLRRNSFQVYHTVYKNVMFALADWIFGCFSGFSATDIYSTWLKQILNLLFTSFPPLVYSIFDRMLPVDIYLSCPWLYPTALSPERPLYFGSRKFFWWYIFGVISSISIVLVPLYTFVQPGIRSDGLPVDDVHLLGQTVYFLAVLSANFAPVPYFHTWYWFAALAYGICFGMWFIAWSVCSAGSYFCPELTSSLGALDGAMTFHLTVGLACTIVVFPLFSAWFSKIVLRPSAPTIIRERIALGVFDVVVAPQRQKGLAVVVPRRDDHEQWRGFAFSEDVTRLQLHLRLSVLPKSVVTQTVALKTAAGIFYGQKPQVN